MEQWVDHVPGSLGKVRVPGNENPTLWSLLSSCPLAPAGPRLMSLLIGSLSGTRIEPRALPPWPWPSEGLSTGCCDTQGLAGAAVFFFLTLHQQPSVLLPASLVPVHTRWSPGRYRRHGLGASPDPQAQCQVAGVAWGVALPESHEEWEEPVSHSAFEILFT